jgi:hypothetical protein
VFPKDLLASQQLFGKRLSVRQGNCPAAVTIVMI